MMSGIAGMDMQSMAQRSGRGIIALMLLAGVCQGASSAHELGLAGLFDKRNRSDLAPLTLASGKPLSNGKPYELRSGGYYRIDVVADGSAELAIGGAEFFRSVWINEVVINDIEVRPLGLDSIEFDDAGVARITFIAIKPGRYELGIPGARGPSQRAVFVIR